MPNPNPALLPRPALFDVTTLAARDTDGRIERVPLDQLELAPNARRDISPEGIARLASMLMRTGQLIPCIGARPDPAGPLLLYDGQRRLLAAQASRQLAGTEHHEDLAPVQSLIVLLLDHEPSAEEIRRIQAQANQREDLSLADQQEQFRDCWQARAALVDDDRVAAVCADLGISAKKAHNLRRQLTLPEPIRGRVAERPAGGQLSVTMANRLADMHDVAPELTAAVAQRITTTDLHDKAMRDLGAFVHRTVVEDEHTYAVRIDDGDLLDGAEHVEHARQHLTPTGQQQAAGILGCKLGALDTELDTLAARARSKALKVRVTPQLRDRARTGRYAYVHDRGQDFAAGIWVVDPVFVLDAICEQLKHTDDAPAREQAYFASATLDDDELRQAADDDRERKQRARARHADAVRANLGLGHDIRAGLMDPATGQLHALKAIVCHLIASHYRDVIAFGAGWTDHERQQPIGDTGRHEPRHIDAILDAELQRALDDPDPLRGIAQLVARWGAAFVLDPDGATRTKALGTERMARKLRDALPGGGNPLRQAVWEFLRPMLSPTLVALNRDAFILDDGIETTVTLAENRADSSLAHLDLGDEDLDPAA
jgi:ParB-like chromosome segregation protein Spo0J